MVCKNVISTQSKAELSPVTVKTIRNKNTRNKEKRINIMRTKALVPSVLKIIKLYASFCSAKKLQ